MAFASRIKLISPLMAQTMMGARQSVNCLQIPRSAFSCIATQNKFTTLAAPENKLFSTNCSLRNLGSDASQVREEKPLPLAQALEQEIQEEMAELSQRSSSDQFPGFSVETNNADVKLTKQVGDVLVIVRFTVSSSLSEWKTSQGAEQAQNPEANEQMFQLMSMPEFQVQLCRGSQTLEVSCFFEDLELDDETGEPYTAQPTFQVDEVVIYEGEPKENEFAVNTEYFRDELLESFLEHLSKYGIDEEFSKNLIDFATNYEKKQYIGLMKRMKDFLST